LHGSGTKVCILICTCDRPSYLRALLEELTSQAPDYPIVIIDNGAVPSRPVATEFEHRLRIIYDRLQDAGVVAARNQSIKRALEQSPEYLVFVDDDEVPEPGWLGHLVGSIEMTGADIATGPVHANFLAPPPPWVVKGQFFVRGPDIATGNLVLRRSCLPNDPNQWFNPKLNFLGAEDEELLKRLMANGARYAPAEKAIVREFVPASRLRRRYVFGLGLRDGLQIVQLDALRGGSRPGHAARMVWAFSAKIGYGGNHLLWAIRTPWRAILAGRDFSTAAGILLGSLGLRARFYGRKSAAKTLVAGVDA
jgi:succinoglycan biosynthesis protein ExoM